MTTIATTPRPSEPPTYFSTLVSSLLSSLSALLSSLPNIDLDHLKRVHRPPKAVYNVLAQPSATWSQLRVPLQVARIVSAGYPNIANSIIGVEVFSMDGGDRWLGQACSEGGWQLVEIMMYFGKLREGIENYSKHKGTGATLDANKPLSNLGGTQLNAPLQHLYQLPPLPVKPKQKSTVEKGVQTEEREEEVLKPRARLTAPPSDEITQLAKSPLVIDLPATTVNEARETISLETSPQPTPANLPPRRNSNSISKPPIPPFTPPLSGSSLEQEETAQLKTSSKFAPPPPSAAASSSSEDDSRPSLLPLPGFAPPKLPSSRQTQASPQQVVSRRTWTRPGLTQEERQLAAQEIFIPSPRESATNRPKRNRRLPNKVAEDGGLVDQDGKMMVGWEEVRKTQEKYDRRKRMKFERGQMGRSGDLDDSVGGTRSTEEGGESAEENGKLSDLKFGQTIFAKFPNYNWWPAVVLDPSTAPPHTQGTRTTKSYLVKSIPTGADHRWIPADSSSIRLIEPSELDKIQSGTYPAERPPPVSWKKWRDEIVQAVELIRNPDELKVWLEGKTEAELWIEAEKERKAARRMSAQTQIGLVDDNQVEVPETYAAPAQVQT
ncbi:hypothetical protein JCM5350_006281 [Sporobolomyces pararoseus]